MLVYFRQVNQAVSASCQHQPIASAPSRADLYFQLPVVLQTLASAPRLSKAICIIKVEKWWVQSAIRFQIDEISCSNASSYLRI